MKSAAECQEIGRSPASAPAPGNVAGGHGGKIALALPPRVRRGLGVGRDPAEIERPAFGDVDPGFVAILAVAFAVILLPVAVVAFVFSVGARRWRGGFLRFRTWFPRVGSGRPARRLRAGRKGKHDARAASRRRLDFLRFDLGEGIRPPDRIDAEQKQRVARADRVARRRSGGRRRFPAEQRLQRRRPQKPREPAEVALHPRSVRQCVKRRVEGLGAQRIAAQRGVKRIHVPGFETQREEPP